MPRSPGSAPSRARGGGRRGPPPFADVHGPMLAVMQQAEAKYASAGYHFTLPDGVHPLRNGHLVMAYAFLKALGCDGDIGTITWDAARGEARATAGHAVIAAGPRELTVESTRYPFCFAGDPASPDSTAGVTAFFPFNQDLNRFRFGRDRTEGRPRAPLVGRGHERVLRGGAGPRHQPGGGVRHESLQRALCGGRAGGRAAAGGGNPAGEGDLPRGDHPGGAASAAQTSAGFLRGTLASVSGSSGSTGRRRRSRPCASTLRPPSSRQASGREEIVLENDPERAETTSRQPNFFPSA